MTDASHTLSVEVHEPADAGERADVILGRRLPGVSRRVARRLALEGHLFLDGHRVPPSTRVPLGGRLTLRVQGPDLAPTPTILELTPRFVYAYKPAGMHTHRLRPDDAVTLADAVAVAHPECRHACPDPRQGGAVHRLDRETTGVVAFARTLDAWREARAGFGARDVLKLYRARVRPDPRWPPCGTGVSPLTSLPPVGPWPAPTGLGIEIAAPLGPAGRQRVTVHASGRPAITFAWPLPEDGAPGQTELLLRLVTGHRHQARVHLAWIDRPIVGDASYGGPPARSLRLHAVALDLSAACSGEPRVHAPLPMGWHDAGEHERSSLEHEPTSLAETDAIDAPCEPDERHAPHFALTSPREPLE
jgi:23S rRNA pseudouridine1911/1915/1917 synthase